MVLNERYIDGIDRVQPLDVALPFPSIPVQVVAQPTYLYHGRMEKDCYVLDIHICIILGWTDINNTFTSHVIFSSVLSEIKIYNE